MTGRVRRPCLGGKAGLLIVARMVGEGGGRGKPRWPGNRDGATDVWPTSEKRCVSRGENLLSRPCPWPLRTFVSGSQGCPVAWPAFTPSPRAESRP